MSISGILAAATQPSAGGEKITGEHFIFIGMLSAIALVVAASLGFLRPSSVDGRLRIDRRRSVWPLAIIWAAGTCIWFGSQMVVISWRQVQVMRAHGGQVKVDESIFTPMDWALLALVPPLIGFLALFMGDILYHRELPTWLGFGVKRLPGGFVRGIGGGLIVLPWTYLVAVTAEWCFQKIDYRHPAEHDLLRVMGEAPRVVRWALIVGATVAAPFFEEFLFRGHLQTLLRQALVRWSDARRLAPLARGFDPIMPQTPLPLDPIGLAMERIPASIHLMPIDSPVASPVLMIDETSTPSSEGATLPAPVILVPPAPQRPPPLPRHGLTWQTWLAIGLTSIVFMLVHVQPWMFPPIFFLSIGLGYVYERTGNLWANITIHALFNSVSTLLYLSQHGRG